MMIWANKPDEYSDSDTHLADLFGERDWERAAKRSQYEEETYRFWLRVSIFCGCLIVAAALSTFYKG